MSKADDAVFQEIHDLEMQFRRLTGREAYGYASKPTPGTWRIVFQTEVVCLTPQEALSYMTGLLAVARQDPANLPYPLNQELPPEQDLRVIHGWTREV